MMKMLLLDNNKNGFRSLQYQPSNFWCITSRLSLFTDRCIFIKTLRPYFKTYQSLVLIHITLAILLQQGTVQKHHDNENNMN